MPNKTTAKVPPPKDEAALFERFTEFTQRLVQVPKCRAVRRHHRGSSRYCNIPSGSWTARPPTNVSTLVVAGSSGGATEKMSCDRTARSAN